MKVTEPEDGQQYAALFDATIRQAVGGSGALMARLVAHVRAALREQESAAPDRRERDRLTHSRRLLNQFESALCGRFSEELLNAFNRISSTQRPAPAPSSLAPLHFDQLAGMDALQLREHVETARVQRAVQAAADLALAELNRLICSLLGLREVRLENNPLRPAVYVEAVVAAASHLPVPSTTRQEWMSMMSAALGHELDLYYQDLCIELREHGVGGGPAQALPAAAEPARSEHSLLTLEKLRQLLARAPGAQGPDTEKRFGPAPPATDGESVFADHGDVPTAFGATIPAAFEALRDMNQVDAMARRLQQPGLTAQDQRRMAREQLRMAAVGLEQLLGLEVVELMVDNITRDPRLLEPVQAVVAALEPALLQLALVDPRFFSHKQHPARRLLHEITHRSIAYESVESRGFSGFMEPLQEAVAPLAWGRIDTAEPFERALQRLVAVWDAPGDREQRQLARAVKALREAEQRNVLACTIVADVQGRADVGRLPAAVIAFLCGPWAQVVANARITDQTGATDPGDFAQAIEDLIWSTQPHLTRDKPQALQQLVPRLRERLQAGLQSIDYPAAGSREFLATLDALHTQAQDGRATSVEPAGAALFPDTASMPPPGDSVWLAPTEAQVSGFIDLDTLSHSGARSAPPPALAPEVLVPGTWVTLLSEDGWTRTRLAWTSPQSTLLLFSDALGYIQSLTRRACAQMFADGQLRILSSDPVEDALDAVARTAMRNSVDIRF